MPNFQYRIAKTLFKTIEDGWCCHGAKSLHGWGTRACGPQALPLHTQQWSQTTAAAQYTVVARFVSGHRVERRDQSCHCCRSICSASGGGGGNGIWDQENSARPPGGKERKHRGRTWQQVPRILSTSEKPAQVLDLPPALRFLSLHTSNICTPMGWLFLLQVSACVKGCPPLDTPSTLYVYISSLLLDYKPLEVQNQTSLTFTMPISSSLDHYI